MKGRYTAIGALGCWAFPGRSRHGRAGLRLLCAWPQAALRVSRLFRSAFSDVMLIDGSAQSQAPSGMVVCDCPSPSGRIRAGHFKFECRAGHALNFREVEVFRERNDRAFHAWRGRLQRRGVAANPVHSTLWPGSMAGLSQALRSVGDGYRQPEFLGRFRARLGVSRRHPLSPFGGIAQAVVTH